MKPRPAGCLALALLALGGAIMVADCRALRGRAEPEAARADGAPRIVSFVPAATEMLFALGLGSNVVGRSRFCDWPPEAAGLPVAGDLLTLDERRVAALGVCSGANAARALSEERPELFCALALCGYSPSSINTDRFPAPTWAFNNTHDEIASIKDVRAAIKNARSRGDSVWLTERPGVHDSWSRALRDDRAVSWLAARAQTDALPPPPYTVCGRRKTAGELAAGFAAPLAALCLVFWGTSLLYRPKRTRNS